MSIDRSSILASIGQSEEFVADPIKSLDSFGIAIETEVNVHRLLYMAKLYAKLFSLNDPNHRSILMLALHCIARAYQLLVGRGQKNPLDHLAKIESQIPQKNLYELHVELGRENRFVIAELERKTRELDMAGNNQRVLSLLRRSELLLGLLGLDMLRQAHANESGSNYFSNCIKFDGEGNPDSAQILREIGIVTPCKAP